MFEGNVDFYRTLGVSKRASSTEIKAAFRKLAKALHPDCNAGDMVAVRQFTAVHHAYTILLNAESRAAYDGYLERVRASAELEAAEASGRGQWSFWREVATTTAATIVLTACVVAGISIWQRTRGLQHDQAMQPSSQAMRPSSASVNALVPLTLSRQELAEVLFGSEPAPEAGKATAQSGTAPAAARQSSPRSTASDASTSVANPASPKNNDPTDPSPRRMDQIARMQAERLVDRGERYLAEGNIAIARLYFVRAADLGLAAAATRLAETFEPDSLARRGVHGVKPDPNEAGKWRKRALELGSETAAMSAGSP
jgi:curved DNA-binding protein CbpA